MKRKTIILSSIFLFSLLMIQMSSTMIMTSVAQNSNNIEIEFIEPTINQQAQPFVDSVRTFVLHFESKASFNNYVDTYNPIEDWTFANLKMVAVEDLLSKKDFYRRIEGVDHVSDITDTVFYIPETPVGMDFVVMDENGIKYTLETRNFLNIDDLWGDGYTGTNVTFFDIDTGIRTDHVDFAGRILPESQSFNLQIYGAPTNDYTIEDVEGHGTHTAGIAAGDGTGNIDYVGMAPDADILVAKIGGNEGSIVYPLAGIAAMNYGVTVDAEVINISWGGSDSEGLDLTEIAVEEMVSHGIVVACSAGNEGAGGLQTIGSPGAAPNSICVAGTTVTGGRYSASSNGPTADGMAKPDVAVPGEYITSCYNTGPSAYATLSGTSMAAPHVAGGVAVLIDALKQLGIQYNPGLFKAALMKASDPGTNTYLSYGAGIPDFYNALTRIQAAPTNGTGFPVIMYAHPYFPTETYSSIPQGFHAEVYVQSTSSTPWEDLDPVLTGNVTALLDLNTTSVTDLYTKNYYIAINIPDDATTGVYTGVITFETAAGVTASTPVKITVTEGVGKILYAKMFTNWGQDSFLGQYQYAIQDLLAHGIAVNEYKLLNITGEENEITLDLLNQHDAIWIADPFSYTFNFTDYSYSGYVEITDSEITAIQDYVTAGGGLFIDFLGLSSVNVDGGSVVEGNNITRLNELISPFDIVASPALFDFSTPVKVAITYTHAVTEGVTYIDHYGTTLTVSGDAIALAKYQNKPMAAIWENAAGGRVAVVSTNFHIDSSGYRNLYNAGTQNNLFGFQTFKWLVAREKIRTIFVEDDTGVDLDIYSIDPAANVEASYVLETTTTPVTLTDLGMGHYTYRLNYGSEGIYKFIAETNDDRWIGEFLFDSTPPEVTSGGWTNYTVPETARLDFKIEDTTTNLVSVDVKLNGAYVQLTGSGKVRTFVVFTSSLNEGNNDLYVYARDAAGNVVIKNYIIPTKKPKGTPVPTAAILFSLLSLAAIITVIRRKR